MDYYSTVFYTTAMCILQYVNLEQLLFNGSNRSGMIVHVNEMLLILGNCEVVLSVTDVLAN